MVVNKVFLRLFLTKVFERVSPENVAHKTVGWRLAEAVDLRSMSVNIKQIMSLLTYALEILKCVQLGTETTVNTQELLVHNSSEGKSAERLHASLIHSLGVFVLALELKGKVICQMATLVVTTHEPESVGVPDLESPKVENTLHIMSDLRRPEGRVESIPQC
jgi:hypothetical protein